MVKIGVVSDSHGNIEGIEKVVPLFQAQDVSFIVHCGDIVEDAQHLMRQTQIPVVSIRGNCDIGKQAGSWFLKTKFAGKTIYACHGDQYGVKRDLDALYYQGIKEEADVVLYGHTHVPALQKRDGILFMNPGALCYRNFGEDMTYGIVSIDGDDIQGKIYPLRFL